jgi:putative ABC transport system substrate-binding protein
MPSAGGWVVDAPWAGLVSFATLPSALARPTRVYRIGVLSQWIPREYLGSKFEPALRKRGYEIGRTLVIDYRLAPNNPEHLSILGAELVAAKVDLIVAPTNPDVLVAKRLTSVIPIVMLFGLVTVDLGLVQSLSHPGGNITGTTVQGPGFSGKFLELLRDTVPNLRRVALMWEPDYSGMTHYVEVVISAARSMGLELIRVPIRSPDDLDAAFSRLSSSRPDALFVSTTGVINSQPARVIQSVARLGVPAIYGSKAFVTAGGLMSYTANYDELMDRSAAIVDRILKGARPMDVPVEEPTNFELVINLKTARALGLVVPQSVLLRAQEVIA